MINIEGKLFHGINLTNYNEYAGDLSELKVLEIILKSGKILNRNDLEKEKTNNLYYLNPNYCQKNNEICLAFHPNNTKYEAIGYYDKITDMTETIDRLLDNKCYEKIKKLFF